MTEARLLYEVTRWEFLRWFKIKDQIKGFVVSALLGLAVWGGFALFQRAQEVPPAALAVSGLGDTAVAASVDAPFELVPGFADRDAAFAALAAGEVDGVLRVEPGGGAELWIDRDPPWRRELEAFLGAAKQRRGFAEAGIAPDALAAILAPVSLRVLSPSAGGEGAGPPAVRGTLADKVGAGIVLGLMTLGIFVGLSYQFIVITGEKQLRVTELVVSAIRPQVWIDGKILGISLLALTSTCIYGLQSLVFLGISRVVGFELPIPAGMTDPGLWMGILALAVGGFLFWTTFFGLVAATIDDPNTSARGGLMILPIVPIAFAFLGLGNPDSPAMRVLSMLPPTASPVMTVRLLLGEVRGWELALALVFLAVGVWAVRRAAGKIFGLAILMVGKEPTWREMARWIRRV
ncbi:MAG: ABC transporter permease [Acidobacteriota bacterium]